MFHSDVYPQELGAKEAERLRARKRGEEQADRPRVGAALSGGGIRSATFCLGVFQALARRQLIGRLDYLSTVSGGGYFGGFLGALIHRDGVAGAEKCLSDNSSTPVKWLREHGRYMSPNGAGDLLVAAAVLLRNWVALHVVIVTALLPVTTLLVLGRLGYWRWMEGGWLDLDEVDCPSVLWSPWFFLATVFAAFLLFFGSIYWLTQFRCLMGPLRSATHFLASLGKYLSEKWRALFSRQRGVDSPARPPVVATSAAEFTIRVRNGLSHGAADALLLTLISAAVAAFDTAGASLFFGWRFESLGVGAGSLLAGAGLFGLGQKVILLLDKLPRGKVRRVPLEYLALGAAFLWASLLLLGVFLATEWVAWGAATELGGVRWNTLGGLLGASLFLSWFFGWNYGFVNLSSHQPLYAARLKRAYIGASNPERKHKVRITEPIAGDDIPWSDYAATKEGPLHLVNVTVNETVSGKSQIEQRDRKGVPLAIGPCGLSFGSTSHALWSRGDRVVEPIHHQGFHAFQRGSSTTTRVEQLALGNWVSISGAAFTTGLGARTSLGLSLLLGLANIRLGYWWDSGVRPHERSVRAQSAGLGRLGGLLGRLFPPQSSILDELMARFHGPARRRWYLSDGGHFENTGCYELLRRRVPFLLATDGGCDGRYEFADIANLVRKARTDFGAEIELLDEEQLKALVDAKVLHADLLELLGGPRDFAAVPAELEDPRTAVPAKRHALLARVTYQDPPQVSAILFLKPSLTGDEPEDVLQYQKSRPSFPQESTMDQDFDEAQWESYRKLGEHVAERLFAPRKGSGWTPADLSCPFPAP